MISRDETGSSERPGLAALRGGARRRVAPLALAGGGRSEGSSLVPDLASRARRLLRRVVVLPDQRLRDPDERSSGHHRTRVRYCTRRAALPGVLDLLRDHVARLRRVPADAADRHPSRQPDDVPERQRRRGCRRRLLDVGARGQVLSADRHPDQPAAPGPHRAGVVGVVRPVAAAGARTARLADVRLRVVLHRRLRVLPAEPAADMDPRRALRGGRLRRRDERARHVGVVRAEDRPTVPTVADRLRHRRHVPVDARDHHAARLAAVVALGCDTRRDVLPDLPLAQSDRGPVARPVPRRRALAAAFDRRRPVVARDLVGRCHEDRARLSAGVASSAAATFKPATRGVRRASSTTLSARRRTRGGCRPLVPRAAGAPG